MSNLVAMQATKLVACNENIICMVFWTVVQVQILIVLKG